MNASLRPNPIARATLGTLEARQALVGAPSRWTLAGKRVVDVVAAGTLLLIASPLWVAVAAYVKGTSGGPVLFQQLRLGRRGTPFWLYKFRTMDRDAEAILTAHPRLRAGHIAGGYKLPDHEDPRITPPGRLLRRTGLDEIPQLLNVLKGEMSLVGPRPIVPLEATRYPEFTTLVEFLRPGITGPWQLGRESPHDYDRRAEIDRRYVTAPSLREDLHLLFLTVAHLFRQAR